MSPFMQKTQVETLASVAKFCSACQELFTPENNTEAAFYRLRGEYNTCRDRIRNAALFIYLNRHCFNGLYRVNANGQFNVPFGRYDAPYFPAAEMLACANKLAYAEVSALDFRYAIRQAGAGDVGYCDPPYTPLSESANFTGYASGGFTQKDQEDLAGLAIQATKRGAVVVISNHDTPYTRRLYERAAEIVSLLVQRNISCDGGNRGKAKELLAVFRP
jgi:DNA adenine methylase